MPILGYGLWSTRSVRRGRPGDAGELPLASLLARALLAFAVAYERRSGVSLAIGSDVLRVLGRDAVRVRDLPARGGVSQEAIAMATGFLQRRGDVAVEPIGAPARGKRIRLTASGRVAQRRHDDHPDGWRASVRQPDLLPHFHMVLHRGGFPDGS